MASEPVLPLEQLLAPIAGENPAGENLLYMEVYDDLKEARRADDDLSRGEWEKDIKVAEWPKVERIAVEALSEKTKDLQIAAMLGEAAVRLHGFDGLRDSLQLMRGLLEQHWDHVYPEIDDGDLDARANALSFMDRYVAQAVLEVPITGSPVGANYSLLQFEESKQFDVPEDLEGLSSDEITRANENKEKAAAAGKVSGEQWRIAKNSSDRAFYEELFSKVEACWDEHKSLDAVMDEKFGNETPGIGDLAKSLERVRDVVEKIVQEKRILEPDPITEEELAAAVAAGGPGAVAGISGPVRTRQDALRRLEEVSSFFRQTEPHSPVSYLVQRAISWGQMPLDLWLTEVIKDETVLMYLKETLGIKSDSSG